MMKRNRAHDSVLRSVYGFTAGVVLTLAPNVHAMGSVPNGCGTNGTDAPAYWFFANGADVQMVGFDQYFCWLTHIEGNWPGSGQQGDTQGVSVTEISQAHDGYWHLIAPTSSDYGAAMCVPAYCFQDRIRTTPA